MAATRRRRALGSGLDVVVEAPGDAAGERAEPMLPWWGASLLGGVVAAVVMWVLVCGLFALGWIAAPQTDPGVIFSTGTRMWLLGLFAGAVVAGMPITVPPLGLTALSLVVATGLAGFATTQARLGAPTELTGRERRSLALGVMGLFTLGHALVVLVISFFVATPEQSARALVGAVVLGGVASAIGAIRGAQWHVTETWPAWARPLPAAVLVSVLVTQVVGAVVLVLALATRWRQVAALHDTLQPGTLGSVLLVVAQVLWLPNLVVWCAAWALGAGFSVGAGSVVSPAINELGLLPAIPVLGALPASGSGSPAQLAWLTGGVVAGAVGALMVLRQRPRARWDETALVGGLVGMLSGLVVVALGLLSSGALGSDRLAHVGVRATVLFVQAPVLLGLAGVVTGAVWGLLRRPAAQGGAHDAATTDTSVVQRPDEATETADETDSLGE